MTGVRARPLDLRDGDLARTWPLAAYLFLIVACHMIGRIARDALFLDRFPAANLPYADIAVAVLAGVCVFVYVRAGRGASLLRLQVASLSVFGAGILFCWWGVHRSGWAGARVLFYVGEGIGGVLAISQVWTLANFILTTRQARRLFGIVGTGGILGGIAGGLAARIIASRWGADALLLAMVPSLPLCAGLVVYLCRQRRRETLTASSAPLLRMRDNVRLLSRQGHVRSIALLVCLSGVIATIAGWQLKAIAKDTLVQTDALAAYLGAFTEYAGLASLAAQLLLTTRVLRRFGIGVALLVLPAALAAGSLLVAVTGALWAAAVLKGSDNAFGDSIDTAALQLLYLPLAHASKLQVKSFIDTVVSKVGDGVGGLLLLALVTNLGLSPRSLGWVVLALTGAWIATAVAARRHYVATLRENVARGVVERPEEPPVATIDHAAANIFAEKLESSDPEEVLYALSLFEMGLQRQTHRALRQLLTHPLPLVRERALVILREAGDRSVRDETRALLGDPDPGVRAEALRYLVRHDRIDPLTAIDRLGDFADVSIVSATITFLVRDSQNAEAAHLLLERLAGESGPKGRDARCEAARLIATLPNAFDGQLDRLLVDDDSTVVREAIAAAAVLRRLRFVAPLATRLSDEPFAHGAADALVAFGDDAVDALRGRLVEESLPVAVRQTAAHVLLRIATPTAAAALSEALVQTDRHVRSTILIALNRLYDTAHGLPLDRTQIETVLLAELMGHYRSYQLLGIALDGADPDVQAAMAAELERVFRLLSLLFPSLRLREAYVGIQSTDAAVHADALEFLDNALPPRLRRLIVPLIDSDVGVEARVRLADKHLGMPPAAVSSRI